jgi:hypothetical protein
MQQQELLRVMLQLTQVLKHERSHDSALARFLVRRAMLAPSEAGHVLFWQIKAEMHEPSSRVRYSIVLETYLRNCGSHRLELGRQSFVMQKLLDVAELVQRQERNMPALQEAMRKGLSSVVLPDRFGLPLCPGFEFSGIKLDSCRVMSSKKLPLWLAFERPPDGATPRPPLKLLFKRGDDVRQDQLVLQVIRVMRDIWAAEGLDLNMSPYGCVSTGDMQGMIEVVPDAETVGSILAQHASATSAAYSFKLLKKYEAMKAVYDKGALRDWLLIQSGCTELPPGMGGRISSKSRQRILSSQVIKDWPTEGPNARDSAAAHAAYMAAVGAFARSCAGYCVAT